MSKIKSFGLLTSSFIIFYLLEVGLGDIFLKEVKWIGYLNETILTFLYSLTVIAFYYLISLYFKHKMISNIIEIIYILICIGFLSLILKFLPIIGLLIPPQMDLMVDLTYFVVILIFGVKILKLKKEKIKFISPLKWFTISLFISIFIIFALVFFIAIELIKIGSLTVENISNIIGMIFIIPYTFGFIFFLNLRKEAAVNI